MKWNESKTNKYIEMKGKKEKKERLDMQSKQRQMKKIYMHSRLTARGKEQQEKKKRINVEKHKIFKKLNLWEKKERRKKIKKGKLYRTVRAQFRGRG